jgi:predicted phosphoribosyltransferase
MAAMRGRVVIIVDDGLATGATMRAAVHSVRKRKPDRLIVAVPVGAAESCDALRREADEVICLSEPADFGAVGFYYRHFEPTGDTEVQAILRASYAERRPGEQKVAG